MPLDEEPAAPAGVTSPSPTGRELLTGIGEQIAQGQHTTLIGQQVLEQQLAAVQRDVATLRYHVLEGNGTPSLITRISTLEVHRGHDLSAVKDLSVDVLGLRVDIRGVVTKLDDLATIREEERLERVKHDRQFQIALIGLVTTAIGGAVAIYAAYLQYVAPLKAALTHP